MKAAEKIVESAAEMPGLSVRPASQFVPYPYNRKVSPEAIEKMAESIREIGVVQPVLARPDAINPNLLEIIAGECRWRGCAHIASDYPVPVLIRDVTDKEASKLHAVENFQRHALDEIDEGRAVKHMRETGWHMDEIAAALGRSKEGLYLRLRLLNLSEAAQEEIRAGNLSIFTAARIEALPEQVREEAVKAVVHPTHRATSLPEKEAVELIDRVFVQPMKQEQEWKERRRVLESEHPAAIWKNYDEAREMTDPMSDFVPAAGRPSWGQISDAARTDQLVVPTWGELAEKHGAKKYIGFRRGDVTATILWVEMEPLIAAEITACDDKPEECIFPHEANVKKQRAEAEKRRMQSEQRTAALVTEGNSLIETILGTGGVKISPTKERLSVREVLRRVASTELGGSDLTTVEKLLGIEAALENCMDEAEKYEVRQGAIDKVFRAKEPTYEVAGRLLLAFLLFEDGGAIGHRFGARMMFAGFKHTDFPAHAELVSDEGDADQEEAA